MAYLSSSTIKKVYTIQNRQIKSLTEWYQRGPYTGGVIASIPKQTYSQQVFGWDTSLKIAGSTLCWDGGAVYTGPGPYKGYGFGHYIKYLYSIEYNLSAMLADLIATYNPNTYCILAITPSSNFELNLDNGSLMIHYDNVTNLPKVTKIIGEGTNISSSEETLNMKDYLKRIVNDMYNGKILSTSIYANQGASCTPVCSGLNQFCCAHTFNPIGGEVYDRRCYINPLTLTVYLVAKSTDLDFTLLDNPIPAPPIDDNKPKPEIESTDTESTTKGAGDEGLSEEYGRDYGISNIGLSDTEVVPPAEFDYIYIPNTIPVSSMDGVVVGVGIVAGHLEGSGLTHTNVYVKSITNTFKDADMMSFVEHVKYSEAGIFNIGDKVIGLIYGETRFLGWIKAKNRVINESEQYIQYEAAGVKQFIDQLPFSAHYRIKNATIAYIFNNIAQYLPKSLVATLTNLTLLPTSIIPEFTIDSASFGHALDSIIDYARKYDYYIDYSKELKVYNLDNLSVVQLTMPTEGTALTASHKIVSKNLSVDVSDCRSRCILRGDYPLREYDELKDVEWTQRDYIFWIGEINLGKRIMSNLLSNTSLPVYIYDKDSLGNVTPYTVTYVDCNTGIIKLLQGNIASYRKSTLHVRYCVKDELHPLKYDSGWKGTAYSDYNIQQVLVQQDTRFRQIILPEGVIRDDSALMSDYANNLLDAVKDWKIGGTIVVDGLDLTLTMGKAVEILNSGCAELANKYMAIMSITWDFENNSTTLNVTNQYYLGTSIIDPINDEKYDERKLIEQIILSRGRQQDFPWVFNQ